MQDPANTKSFVAELVRASGLTHVSARGAASCARCLVA